MLKSVQTSPLRRLRKEYIAFKQLNSGITAVALDPNPEKLQENIILRFRNLKVRIGSKSVSIVLRCDIYSEYMISVFIFRA